MRTKKLTLRNQIRLQVVDEYIKFFNSCLADNEKYYNSEDAKRITLTMIFYRMATDKHKLLKIKNLNPLDNK